MTDEEMVWDHSQKSVLDALETGANLHVVGGPGSGKTALIVEAMRRTLEKSADGDFWAPALVVVPDRRRAVQVEGLLAKTVKGRSLTGLSAGGSHRLVRSLSSYAYLVVALWMVERENPGERPTMLSGAKEDAWLQAFLAQNPVPFAPQVVGSEPFRMEIRNLMARAGQMGLLPGDLVELGRTLDLPLWELAGRAYGEYAGWQDAFTLDTAHMDAARIPRIAAHQLRSWEREAKGEGVLAKAPLPSVLLMDDVQDMPASTVPLVQALADAGVQIVFTSSVDEAAAGFRGGDPGLGEEVAEMLQAPTLTLEENHRNEGDVGALVAGMAHWFQPKGAPDLRDSGGVAGAGSSSPQKKGAKRGGTVDAQVLPTASQQNAMIAAILREANLYGGTPWENMAVIARHAGTLEVLEQALTRAEIPVRSGERPVVLSRVPICAATLALLMPTDSTEPAVREQDAEALAAELVVSPLVRADTLGVFRVLRDFRLSDPQHRELGIRNLLEAIATGKYVASNPGLHRPFERLQIAAKLWSRREKASLLPAEQGLWSIWEGANLGEDLRARSMRRDYRGRIAAEELDSMLALFRKADLWNQERMEAGLGDGSAAQFAQEILGQSIATDPLVPKGLAEAGVTVATPTQAAGNQWDLVVVADLQEGSWPAPSRAGLGDRARLENIVVDAAARGWVSESPVGNFLTDPGVAGRTHPGTEASNRRREEARLLYVGVSRATKNLHLLSVSNEDSAPSSFLSGLVEDGLIDLRTVRMKPGEGRPLTLDSVVAQARRTLVGETAGDVERQDAAKILALLWDAGHAAADPKNWAATGSLSSDAAVLEQGPLRLGPSTLEQAQNCGLRWFLGSVGGAAQEIEQDPTDLNAARIGTLVHQIAEENPRGTAKELLEALHSKWEQQGFGTDTVWQRRALQAAEEKVARLGAYLSSYRGEVLIEQRIRFEVEGAVISGRADRIEIDDQGKARVVDIKTGSVGTVASAQENPQLSAYQIGVAEEGLVPGGAALLALNSPKETLRLQDALTEEQVVETKGNIGLLARRLSGSHLEANPLTGNCRTCEFLLVCPAKPNSERNCE